MSEDAAWFLRELPLPAALQMNHSHGFFLVSPKVEKSHPCGIWRSYKPRKIRWNFHLLFFVWSLKKWISSNMFNASSLVRLLAFYGCLEVQHVSQKIALPRSRKTWRNEDSCLTFVSSIKKVRKKITSKGTPKIAGNLSGIPYTVPDIS